MVSKGKTCTHVQIIDIDFMEFLENSPVVMGTGYALSLPRFHDTYWNQFD